MGGQTREISLALVFAEQLMPAVQTVAAAR
jgi:hypothetical protein